MVGTASVIAMVVMIGSLAYPFLRKALATLAIAIGLFIVFALELMFWPSVINDLAFSPETLRTGNSIFTIFTSIFLHGSIIHIFLNVLVLVFIGMMLEERIGKPRFVAIFLIAGIVGNLTYGLANFGASTLAVGASGAIFGIMGAILVLYPREPSPIVPLPIPVSMPIWVVVLIFIVLQIGYAFSPGSGVAWQAHVGGLATGMVIAPLMMRLRASDRLVRGERIDIMKMAHTPKEKEIAARIASADVADVRGAWLEEFSKTARCPICGAALEAHRGGLKCKSGHRFSIQR